MKAENVVLGENMGYKPCKELTIEKKKENTSGWNLFVWEEILTEIVFWDEEDLVDLFGLIICH